MVNIFDRLVEHNAKIAVIGLGYVGLQLAVSLSRFIDVIGYDTNKNKVNEYKMGIDKTGDVGEECLSTCSVEFTTEPHMLSDASCFIIAVPTPVRNGNVPDLNYVEKATKKVAKYLKVGDLVIYESTVYPGVTEEVCLPLLQQGSGLMAGKDFKLGYSPERINPGDREHRLDNITKIVSGIDDETTETLAQLYSLVTSAGVYRASSIKVAEAAKVVENAQRDVNIAFMNELAILFSKMNINTADVLEAARTKWNFLDFRPGLVGGHCIGIDPYYLSYKAEDEGLPSKLILNSRHINDSMGKFIANQMIKHILRFSSTAKPLSIALLGMTYKENSHDIRNSKVIDVIRELTEYGVKAYVCDPNVDEQLVAEQYGITITRLEDIHNVNMVALMVPHHFFVACLPEQFRQMYDDSLDNKLFFDIKGAFDQVEIQRVGLKYWSL